MHQKIIMKIRHKHLVKYYKIHLLHYHSNLKPFVQNTKLKTPYQALINTIKNYGRY